MRGWRREREEKAAGGGKGGEEEGEMEERKMSIGGGEEEGILRGRGGFPCRPQLEQHQHKSPRCEGFES